MTEQVDAVLTQIQEKLALLTQKNRALNKENQLLKETVQESKAAVSQATKLAQSLQNQLDSRKYVQATMNDEEKKAFEKKIRKYIKEIDQCIALLNE